MRYEQFEAYLPTPLLSWRRGSEVFYAGVTDSGEDVTINFKLKPRDIGYKDIECLVSDALLFLCIVHYMLFSFFSPFSASFLYLFVSLFVLLSVGKYVFIHQFRFYRWSIGTCNLTLTSITTAAASSP